MKFIKQQEKIRSKVLNKFLENKNIIITRSAEESKDIFAELEENGAKIIFFPTIKIKTIKNNPALDEALSNYNEFDYLVFTSPKAVKVFIELLNSKKVGIDYSKINIVVTGEKTAKTCKVFNIPVDIIPKEYSAKGIIAELKNKKLNGKKFLIPTSAIARDELKEGLKDSGAIVNDISIYNVVIPSAEDLKDETLKIREKKPDIFVFTSPSTYYNFLNIMNIVEPKEYFKGLVIAAIGTTTADAINKTGVDADIVPNTFTLENLVKEIIDNYEPKTVNT